MRNCSERSLSFRCEPGAAEFLDAVARQIAEESDNPSIGVHGDVTDEMTIKRMVCEIHDQLDHLDILVNNVGSTVGAGGPGDGKPNPNDAVFIP